MAFRSPSATRREASREGRSAPLGSAACGANSLGRRAASAISATVKPPANETDISSRNGVLQTRAAFRSANGFRVEHPPSRQRSLRRKRAGREESERKLGHREVFGERHGHLEPQWHPARNKREASREGQSAPLDSAACGAISLGGRRASVSSDTVKPPAAGGGACRPPPDPPLLRASRRQAPHSCPEHQPAAPSRWAGGERV